MNNTALLLVDLQNDFIHAEGAYGRAGQGNAAIAALPAKLKPLVDLVRSRGGIVIATLFTLVPGRGGEPIISPHLKIAAPVPRQGRFRSGLVGPAARRRACARRFHRREARLFGLLHDPAGVDSAQDGDRAHLCRGIVTNGGVASTVRDAHVREFEVTVLEDGCAAFSAEVHRAAIEGLRPVAAISTIAKAGRRHRVGMSASPTIKSAAGRRFESAGVVIVGAGAAGLCAALRAAEAGVPVVVVERDKLPAGSTALSAGLIPAAGTRFQRAKGIEDSAELFARDIQAKAHGEADPALVRAVSEGVAPTVEWLADRYGFPFEVIDNFNYPGHSAFRMHGLPTRSGAELIDRLRTAAEQAGHSDSHQFDRDHAVCRSRRKNRRDRLANVVVSRS